MAEYRLIPVDKIQVDPEQVRRTFREESEEGLAQSIREVGMLHPILVTPLEDGETYRLVSGERRLRAARLLGESMVPALILRELPASATCIQLIENLQREDLNPIERALGIRALMEKEGLSKAAAAARLGVPRTTLTDWLDVLDLEPRYQAALVENFMGRDSPLTLSHVAEAKALAARLGSPKMVSVLLDAVLEYGLSKAETRRVAQLVRSGQNISVAQAVRIVRGQSLPSDEELADGLPAKTRARSKRQAPARASTLERVMRLLDRLRAVLAYLIGGVLYELTPQQRQELVDYLTRIRRWVDDVVTFAREVDNPELAEQRRQAMRQAAKRRKRRRGAQPAAVARNGYLSGAPEEGLSCPNGVAGLDEAAAASEPPLAAS